MDGIRMNSKYEVMFQSPNARDPSEIPEISVGEYLINKLRNNLPRLQGRTWMHDISSGNSVKFDEIEDLSRRFGSALTRLGFKKRDVLIFVTYEACQLFVLCLTVWRLGGITKVVYQLETKETHVKNLNQGRPKYILIDDKTAPMMLDVVKELKYSPTLLSFGDVEGTISVKQMLQDDGSAFPEHVEIRPKEDVLMAIATSGSTGIPKGVIHTHYSVNSSLSGDRDYFKHGDTLMLSTVNFTYLAFAVFMESLCVGGTVYINTEFNRDTHFDLLLKHKPDTVIMYPHNAALMARSLQMKSYDLSFLKSIYVTSSVLDAVTVKILHQVLPNVTIEQNYVMTECMLISTTKSERYISKIPVIYKKSEDGKEFCVVSTGKLAPYKKAKVVDVETGKTLPVGQRGEIIVKSPSMMIGYYNDGKPLDCSNIDADGWWHTGDYGFFDEDANLFIIDRIYNLFKYNSILVAPSEIEALLLEHEAVQAAGVVAIPNVATDNLARAFVVLRPGCHVTATADELQAHVAARLPEYKHLHGGVRFIDVLPVNRNNKIDRAALKKRALNQF